ncbi:MAG: hypothetical protein QOE30_3129 [Mycobacterium sp.]|jgi:hypothetical protein|nr:hypothetical protein [Mycobacterium sp.]
MTARSTRPTMIARSTGTMIARTPVPTMIAAIPTMIAITTTIARSAPVVVAIPPIPVVAPAGVPKVAWAPLREGPGLGLSVSCNAQSCQPQAGDHYESRCSQT